MAFGEIIHLPISVDFHKAGQQYLEANNQTVHLESYVTIWRIVYVAILTFYIPVILMNNIIVITVTCLFSKMRTSDNYILASLALADFFVGLLAIPMSIANNLPYIQLLIFSSQSLCMTWMAVTNFALAGSLFNLLLLCLERSIAINWPLHYTNMLSRDRTLIYITLVWIIDISFFFVPVYLAADFHSEIVDPEFRCNVYTSVSPWYILATIGTTTVCLMMSLILYLQVFVIVIRQLRSQKQLVRMRRLSQAQNRFYHKRSRSVLFTASLMTLFIFLWLPNAIIGPQRFNTNSSLSPSQIETLRLLAQLIHFSNSITDTFVYAWCKPEYKTAFMLLLTENPSNWKSLAFKSVSEEPSLSFSRESFQRKSSGFYHFDVELARSLSRNDFHTLQLDEPEPPIILSVQSSNYALGSIRKFFRRASDSPYFNRDRIQSTAL